MRSLIFPKDLNEIKLTTLFYSIPVKLVYQFRKFFYLTLTCLWREIESERERIEKHNLYKTKKSKQKWEWRKEKDILEKAAYCVSRPTFLLHTIDIDWYKILMPYPQYQYTIASPSQLSPIPFMFDISGRIY